MLISPDHELATRRGFLRIAGGGLGALLVPGRSAAAAPAAPAASTVATFYSRPDLRPPVIDVTTVGPAISPGYVFLAPASGPGQYGPLIIDNQGEPVWFLPVSGPVVNNFRAQTYEGQPVLTWWEGTVTANGYGQGDYLIADTSYQVVKRFGAVNGYRGDLHEFVITSRNTALISIYNEVPVDLTAYGGTTSGVILEGVIQEIDIRSGELLFEWHSLGAVDPSESDMGIDNALWDYFHLNSIGVLPDGNLLISARHTSAIYKINRKTGNLIWRLGGKKSDFAMGADTTFAYQHDARGHRGNVISMFDDGGYGGQEVEPTSRALVLQLDTATMTAAVVRSDVYPHTGRAVAEGSAQILPDDGIFVGWGTLPGCSEFSPTGELRFDAQLAGAGTSYRAYRDQWAAQPASRPALKTLQNDDGSITIFASWNGATNVSHWQAASGPTATSLKHIRTVPRTGFETPITLPTPSTVISINALDPRGRILATTTATQVRSTSNARLFSSS